MSMYIDSIVAEGLVDLKQLRMQSNAVTVASATQTMTAADTRNQYYTGSVAGQIVKAPDATTLTVGYEYLLINDSSVNLTVQDGAAGAIVLLNPGQRAYLQCMGVGSAAGIWALSLFEKTPQGEQFKFTYPGTGLIVNYTGGNYRNNGTLTAVAAGAITLPASTTGTIYVSTAGVITATASIPDGATPLYSFVTSAGAVTALADVREEIENNETWGAVGDISTFVTGEAKSAGTLEKFARADHKHGNTMLLQKSGLIAAGTFSGSPKTAAVVFTTAFANANYSIAIRSIDNRSWTYQSKTATGFTINANANQALTGEVTWMAEANGETS